MEADPLPDKPLTAVEKNYRLFDHITGGRYPLLKRIGECESGFRMVANTSGSSAFGIFQILKVHDQRAVKMGLSRQTVEGNIKLAVALFEEQGSKPWDSSRHCWDDKNGKTTK